MHRTTTAPSPLNLVTTWFVWVVEFCRVSLIQSYSNLKILIDFSLCFSFRRSSANVSDQVLHKWCSLVVAHKALEAKQVRNGCRKSVKVRWLQKVCISQTFSFDISKFPLYEKNILESSSRCFSHYCV